MFMRTSSRRNKDGSVVRYLQLAHNEWDPGTKSAKMRVLYNFGRTDQVDRAAIERLIASLTKTLDPDPVAAQGGDGPAGLAFESSRPLGGAWVLDHLWSQLGIGKAMGKLLAGGRREPVTERVCFALVANRALAPSSKLAAASWVGADVHIPGLPEVSDDACYRAMDWLLSVEDTLAKTVYDNVADLLNLEVDLLFFDTTSIYFETESADEPVWRDQTGQRLDEDAGAETAPAGAVKATGFRTYGKSKDHREDLPQVVIGMAVTRTGIPVRVWSWPGNTADSALIRQVKDDMAQWNLGKVVWVADRGFTSAENRRYLQRAGGGYILGEKLRSGSAEATAALSRQGRYQEVTGNLRVKEVRLGDGDRFVIAHNPDQAVRDAAIRAELVARLQEMIAGTDKLSVTKRAQLRGVISTKPGLNRYLRVSAGGLLRVDRAAITAEAKLDGKYLLRTNEPTLSAEDLALGYKQLLEVERGWRDMKQILNLRPVHHRLEDCIRAHVILCWLALLLIRIIETTTTQTWTGVRAEMQRLHLGQFTGPAGTYRQTTTPTTAQRQILTALQVPTPPRILDLTTP
ncbi:IS1634 family transposase [Georgenia muralis]|uniref:IS4 family transposase n=1 Tax=Georgenia muralis TaxID=154117 RepID=A0A3N4Z891_9MICO|nr:IS1634 family transposase [Georgenia muralis]RPF28214.1 IS4 family transposase [Georgenia muralis]